MSENQNLYKAVVVGAGPAGITTVANLIQQDMTPILWIDPAFKVGRFSSYYNVPANTRNKYFLDYFNKLPIFQNETNKFTRYWDKFDLKDTSHLLYMVDALQESVHFLSRKYRIEKVKTTASKVEYKEGKYIINDQYLSEYLFLCTGCHPLTLDLHSESQSVVDFDEITNDKYLDVEESDRFAIFGSSHSAMLAAMNLSKYTSNIVIFHRSEPKYATFVGDKIMYDNTGLKGEVAEWTRRNWDSIEKCLVSGSNFKESFKACNKVIYAVGFRRNTLPDMIFDGEEIDKLSLDYDKLTGKMHEKMYGFGIAFPNQVDDVSGEVGYAVGVWKFMVHVNKIILELAKANELSPLSKGEQNRRERKQVIREVLELMQTSPVRSESGIRNMTIL